MVLGYTIYTRILLASYSGLTSTNKVQVLLHTPTYDVTTTGNNLTTENYVGIAQNTASANEEVRTKYTNIDDQENVLPLIDPCL